MISSKFFSFLQSLPQLVLIKIKQLSPTLKVTFLTAIIFGLACHGFMYLNKLPNHDDVGNIFYTDGLQAMSLGRWFLKVPVILFSGLSLPWAQGLIVLTFLAITACLLVQLFKLKHPLLGALTAALVVSFPTITMMNFYLFTASAYAVALFLVVLTVFITAKYSHSVIAHLMAVITLCLSLAIYQAFYPFFICLTILVLLQRSLTKNTSWRGLLSGGGKLLMVAISALLLYLLSVKLTVYFGFATLTTYKGAANMGQINFNQLPNLAIKAFLLPVNFYFFDTFLTLHKLATLLFGISIVFSMVIIPLHFLRQSAKQQLFSSLIWFFLGAILLFGSSGLICVMSPDAYPNLLMIYPLISLPLLLIIIAQELTTKSPPFFFYRTTVVIALLVFIYNNFLWSNKQYLALQVAYERGFAYSAQLITRIQSLPDYQVGLPVNFINTPMFNNIDISEASTHLFNNSNISMSINIPAMYSYHVFLREYVGFNDNPITPLSAVEVCELEPDVITALDDLSIYPNADSIIRIGNAFYVKFQALSCDEITP